MAGVRRKGTGLRSGPGCSGSGNIQMSPPVLGAAAFLIAEYLRISYLDVLLMAVIPTLLYYLALFIMVELDARKFGIQRVEIEARNSAWNLAASACCLLKPSPTAASSSIAAAASSSRTSCRPTRADVKQASNRRSFI